MNMSKSFNHLFLYSCAVLVVLSAHTQGANIAAARDPDDMPVRPVTPTIEADIRPGDGTIPTIISDGTTAAISVAAPAPEANTDNWSLWSVASETVYYTLGAPGAVISGTVYAATSAASAVGSVLPWGGATEAPPAAPTAAAAPALGEAVEAVAETPAPVAGEEAATQTTPGILEILYNQLPDISGSLNYALRPIFTTAYDTAVAVGHRAVKAYVETTRWADYCNKLFQDSLTQDGGAFANLKLMSQNDPIAKAYVAVVLHRALFAEEGVTPTQLANETLEYLRYWDTCGIGEATIALGILYEEGLAAPEGVNPSDHGALLGAAQTLYQKVAASYPAGQIKLNAFLKTYGSNVTL
jgi:hypothetical protein